MQDSIHQPSGANVACRGSSDVRHSQSFRSRIFYTKKSCYHSHQLCLSGLRRQAATHHRWEPHDTLDARLQHLQQQPRNAHNFPLNHRPYSSSFDDSPSVVRCRRTCSVCFPRGFFNPKSRFLVLACTCHQTLRQIAATAKRMKHNHKHSTASRRINSKANARSASHNPMTMVLS